MADTDTYGNTRRESLEHSVYHIALLESHQPRTVLHEPYLGNATVGKTDLVSFTAKTELAQELGETAIDQFLTSIARYHDEFSIIENQYNGVLIGTEGDAVIWANRRPEEAIQASRDVHAALANQERVPPVYVRDGDKLTKEQLEMRVGLATAPVYIGYAESNNRVIPVFGGPAVDTSYLMEECAPPGDIAVDEHTKRLLSGHPFTERVHDGHTVWVPQPNGFHTRKSRGFYDTRTIVHDPRKRATRLTHSYAKGVLQELSELREKKGSTGRYQPGTLFFAELPILKNVLYKAIGQAEQHGDVTGALQDVRELYNAHFRVLQPAIEDHGGSVIKLYKDKIIGGFGIPHVIKNPRQAARHMNRYVKSHWQDPALLELMNKYNVDPETPFIIGAIHSGIDVLAGFWGKGYDVLGDPVNLTARLQANASQKVKTGDITPNQHTCIVYSKQALNDPTVRLSVAEVTKFLPKGKRFEVAGFHIEGEETREAKQLVGRTREIRQLDQIVQHYYKTGETNSIQISAPAGYGKSELTKAFQEHFDGTVYNADALEFASDVPYHAIQQLAKNVIGITDDASKEDIARTLHHRTPAYEDFLDNWLSLGIKEEHEQLSKKQLEKNILDSLEQLISQDTKALVTLQDAHWADEDSLRLFKTLAERTPHTLFLTNYRPDELEHTDHIAGELVELDEFDEEGTGKLLEQLHGSPLSKRAQHFVHRHFTGVPVYIETAYTWMTENGLITNNDLAKPEDKIILPGDEGSTLSDRVQEMTYSRADKLNATEKRYLQFASLMDGSWTADYLNVTGHDAIVANLVKKRFLEQDGDTISWHHDLTKKAIRKSLRAKDRADMHTTLGRLMEIKRRDNIDAHLDELAYHFEHGKDVVRGAKYMHKVIQRRSQGYQTKQVVDLSTRLEAFLADKPTKPDAGVHIGKAFSISGLAYTRLNQPDEAERIIHDALAIAETLPEDDRDQVAKFAHGNLAWVHKDDIDRFKHHYQESLTLAEKMQDTESIAKLKLGAGYVIRGEEGIHLLRDAIAILSEQEPNIALGNAYVNLGSVLRDDNRAQESLTALKTAIDLADKHRWDGAKGRYWAEYALTLRATDGNSALAAFAEAEKHLKQNEDNLLPLLYKYWAETAEQLGEEELKKEIEKKSRPTA